MVIPFTTGYYRVNYDSQNWLLLAAHLQFATSRPIPVLNRAQIVNDAFYFTTTGRMEPQLFFDVIKFLNNETSYIVWHPMFNILSYMSAFLKHPVGESAKVRKNKFNELFSCYFTLSVVAKRRVKQEYSALTCKFRHGCFELICYHICSLNILE